MKVQNSIIYPDIEKKESKKKKKRRKGWLRARGVSRGKRMHCDEIDLVEEGHRKAIVR